MAATAEHRRIARALTMHLDALGTGMPTRDEIIDWLIGLENSGDTLAQLITDLAAVTNGEGASMIGIEDAAGDITATTVEGALAENRAAIDVSEADIAALQALPALTIATLTLTDADLVASGGVTTDVYDFAAALPDKSLVLAVAVDITEGFDDVGASSTTTFTVGESGGDVDGYVTSSDMTAVGFFVTKAAALLGAAGTGITPSIEVTSDVDLDTFTTGALVATVLYYDLT